MDKLKPCPFCGGEVTRVYTGYNGLKDCVRHHYHCLSCQAICFLTGGKRWSYAAKMKAEAIKAWNTRPDNWISVEDRLPEFDKYGEANVLVHFDDGFIATATYDRQNGWELWQDSGEPTHWQPLPEPPKEVE